MFQVYARWEAFTGKVKDAEKAAEKPRPEMVEANFPFLEYFSNAPQPLFKVKI